MVRELARDRSLSGHRALARALAEDRDVAGVAEVAAALGDDAPRVTEAALAVFGEVAAIEPSLVAPHLASVAALLAPDASERTWRAVVVMAAIAPQAPAEVVAHAEAIALAVEGGSVIAADHGVGALAWAATVRAEILPVVLDHLASCGSTHVCLRGERCLPAVTARNAASFLAVLGPSEWEQSRSAAARLRRLMRAIADVEERGERRGAR